MKYFFGKIGKIFSGSILFKFLSNFFGDPIIKAAYERNYSFTLKCDLYLLKVLSEPTTVYDVIKKLDYPHSTAYNILQEYLDKGIIEQVKSEHLKSGLTKKYYRLTELGFSLLDVVERISENMLK